MTVRKFACPTVVGERFSYEDVFILGTWTD
jgi:hypothetical protein